MKVKSAGPGKYCDGAGLWIFKSECTHGKWVWRYAMFGRRREMGLGNLADVSHKHAREAASRWRALVADGKDPINRLQKNSNVTAAHRSELEKPSKIAPKLRFWRHFWPKYRILSLLRHPKNPFSAACSHDRSQPPVS